MATFQQIQQRLNALGANPPLTVDGIWGAKSIAATAAFQKSKGLVADGVAGPKTLAALGLSDAVAAVSASNMGQVSPATLSSYQKAYEIAKRAAPSMPEAQKQYVLSVSAGEGGLLGAGWAHPSAATIAKSQEFGLTGYEGAESNNWGATQGSGDAGSFPHVDSGWMVPDENGKPTSKHWQGSGPKVWGNYVANYKKWTTPEKGFLDIAKVILNGGKRGATGAAEIQAAINAGNLRKAVFAQHANGYFELNPEQYLSAVLTNYSKMTSAIGWKKLLAENGVAAAISGLGIALIAGLSYVGYRYFTKG